MATVVDFMPRFKWRRTGSNEKDRKEIDDKLGFLTEVGFESTNHGLQVFGGHGYIIMDG